MEYIHTLDENGYLRPIHIYSIPKFNIQDLRIRSSSPHQHPDTDQNDSHGQQNRTGPSRDETGHGKSQSQHDE
jgi:hypothetical protein